MGGPPRLHKEEGGISREIGRIAGRADATARSGSLGPLFSHDRIGEDVIRLTYVPG